MILKIKNDNGKQSIEYHCNNCGFIKTNINQNCIIENDYNLQQLHIQDKNIKYIADDPTNPRLNNIPCPNKDCNSHKTQKYDVVFISINDEDMKFLYLCNECKDTWTNN
jgi:DNA-directed RNA polymerase subunit M/transcription elongation factor TFIIS